MLAWAAALLFAVAARAESPALAQLRALTGDRLLHLPIPGASRALAPGEACLFDARTGLPARADEAFARAAAAQVVYAGESHDQASHHRRQKDLLRALAPFGPAAAFEMLYAWQQPVLDRYLSGALDDAGFEAEVDWKKTWGFPFSLYKPVFDELRAGSRRGAALNVSKAVVHKVARSGLGSLTPEERAEVPAGFEATKDPAYLAMLRETFLAHGGGASDAAGLARFVDAMSLWNEGMAANLARFLENGAGGPVVVVAGAFHAYSAGMPASLERRRPGVSQVSFILESAPSCPTSVAPATGLTADYKWVALP